MHRTRVVGYVRVSTEDQRANGFSLEVQEAKLRAYCAAMDLDLVSLEVDEGLSAKSLKRPGLQRALGYLRSKRADGLLVAKLDRLTRSVKDLGKLLEDFFEKRNSLLSVSDSIDTRSAAGRLMLNVLTSVAQWEREATGERTSAVSRYRSAKQLYLGGQKIPYGYLLDGKQLVEVPSEQEILAEARRLHASGSSLRAISKSLAAQGRVSRAGRPFVAPQIRRMVLPPPPSS